jgi:hypothetical protein
MQEDSNALKNALFGYCMQKLYGFKVLLVDVLKLHIMEQMLIVWIISINKYPLPKILNNCGVSKALAIISLTQN